MEVDIVPVEEVAATLHTHPMKIKTAILNGTMPIGALMNDGGRDRTIIIRARWEAWVQAKDLRRD